MEENETRTKTVIGVIIFLEIAALLIVSSFLFNISSAQVGQNVTTRTNLTVGNSAPEIMNITIYQDTGSGIDLVVNSTKEIVVEAIIRDYNGEADVLNTTIEFYDAASSFYGDVDDNNDHYTNLTCEMDLSYGDSTQLNATCRFNLLYYADNATWNVSVYSSDQAALVGSSIKQTKVNTLLGLGLPDEINYGQVNATNVSSQREINVSNYGNVRINLSLEGYAFNRGDGWAMNCTLGTLRNISIGYEKYNLTTSNLSVLNFTSFQTQYQNLSNNTVIKYFGLNQRFNDVTNEAYNATYWRIYVPLGVAGSCTGNIIMGATRATGS